MKNISVLSVILIFSSLSFSCSDSKKNQPLSEFSFYVASWNVENLFDVVDNPNKSDEWFLPNSEINWTEDKLTTKLKNLSRVINYMNDNNGPDILGLQEVEEPELLDDLINNYLDKPEYKFVYSESPDTRGIDNALIYNRQKFNLVSSSSIAIEFDEPKSSRKILFAQLKSKQSNEQFSIFVNHWPSRRKGLKETEKFRINAAEALINSINSLKDENENPNIIVVGDFNDLPTNISITKVLGAKRFECNKENEKSYMYNLSTSSFQKGNGSYKYRDHWNMLDQLIVSESLVDNNESDYVCNSFEVIKPPFVIQKSGKYKGTPLPTYGGRKYLGGFSDHYPVGAEFMSN